MRIMNFMNIHIICMVLNIVIEVFVFSLRLKAITTTHFRLPQVSTTKIVLLQISVAMPSCFVALGCCKRALSIVTIAWHHIFFHDSIIV